MEDELIALKTGESKIKTHRTENVFLTGVTGILGSHLLKQFLTLTDVKLYCLIRANSNEHAYERLLTFLKVYDPNLELVDEFQKRVVPVVGDVSQPLLGMSLTVYEELQGKIDATFHVAALTNLFMRYRLIEPVNLGGTKNIVQFVLGTKSKYLCQVSSHTVMGDKTFESGFEFKESDFDLGQGFENMPYQQTKFLAEKHVREATKEGLIWNIMRPGQIFGESQTGRYPLSEGNVSGLFYDILKTVIETRVAMESGTYFDVVPVDYVSRAILELGFEPTSTFHTYHLINPNRKTYGEVIGVVKKLGFEIDVIPQTDYKDLLMANALRYDGAEYKSSTTSAFKWWFKRGIWFYDSAFTNCEATSQILKNKNINCPPVDQALLNTYIRSAIEQKYLVDPRIKMAAKNTFQSQEVELAEMEV